MSTVLSTVEPPDLFVRGEGAWLTDGRGRRYLDARAGMANVMLGYGRADIARAMYRQATVLPYAPLLRHNRPAWITIDYAAALAAVAPPSLTRVRLTHTGSSAVECAIHIARRYQRNHGRGRRITILSLDGGYHGSTLMTMAAGGERMLHDMFAPMPDGFVRVPPPSDSCPASRDDGSGGCECTRPLVEALSTVGEENVAAFVLEPLMGRHATELDEHYLRRVRQICSAAGILLVFDEVFTGFGRVGPMFVAGDCRVEPDILCLAKGITAGYAPLGAVVVTDQVFDAFDRCGLPHFIHGSTTDGHPVSCAAGLAVLHAYARENVLANGARMSSRLRDRLSTELRRNGTRAEIRGRGAFIAIDLRTADGQTVPLETRQRVEVECARRGVLVDYTRVISVVPPLTLTDDEVDVVAATVSEVLEKIGG